MTLDPDIERLALLGWRLFPAVQRRGDRRACIKQPAANATCDVNQLETWSSRFRDCNWRVVMGGSRIWALDCDVPGDDHADDGVEALRRLVASRGPLPKRPMTRTGGGGLGLFFRHDGEPIRGGTGWPAPGIDPRRGALSMTVPPSIHHTTGLPYLWIVPPWQVSPPTAPAWLLAAVAPPPEPPMIAAPEAPVTPDRAWRRLCRAVERVTAAVPGGRNDALNRAAYSLAPLIWGGQLGDRDVSLALYGAARRAGLDHAEAAATIKSGLRSGARLGQQRG